MKARIILGTLVALFALLTLLDRFVLLELLARRTGLAILLALAEALAITGAGALARRAKSIDAPIDFLIGYPIFGALCFLVGTIRINAWTMAPLLVIGVAAFAWMMRSAREHAPLPSGFWFLISGFVLASGFVAAQAPPASLDELAYHLAVPQQWVLEGRAVELPLLSHSYFPLGIESADLPLFAILGEGGGMASHFLHLLAALATILVIARRTESWLATAAIATTPALAITAGWSLVDWPLAGLFAILFVALESDDRDTASAATAAGLLTKYTFAPFALIAWLVARRIPKWPALLGLLFFVRNLILTGNPIAPFLGADAPHVSGFRDLYLTDYIFDGAFVDESLGAALLALAVFATGRIAVATLLCGMALFFLAPSARILVPFLVVPAISGAPALRNRLFTIVIATAVVVQTFLVVWTVGRTGAFSLLAGATSDEQYIAKARQSTTAVTWLHSILPRDSRTLVIGLGETYWFSRRVRGGGNFDGPRVSRYLETETPEALRERLRRDGITHVAIIAAPPPTKVEQKRNERQTTLSPAAQRALARMLDRYAATVTSRGNATLFTLR